MDSVIKSYLNNLPIYEPGCIIIDFDQLQENYRQFAQFLNPSTCAAVIKSDAYGLGMEAVGLSLFDAGCRDFYVASLAEGIKLRQKLPLAQIFVLSGLYNNTTPIYSEYNLTPCLNTLDQIDHWLKVNELTSTPLPAVLHIDTGMNRTGIPEHQIPDVIARKDKLEGAPLKHIMSHLSCSEDKDHTENKRQLECFSQLQETFPKVPLSLSSSTIVHFDDHYKMNISRVGYGLFGFKPTQHPNIKTALHIYGRVIQVKDVPANVPIGYGANYKTTRPTSLATINVGYGDGYERYYNMNGEGAVFFNGKKAPVVGRLSMDFVVADITDLQEHNIGENSWAELIGPNISVADLLPIKGFLPHDIPISLGNRLKKAYISNKTIIDA